MIQNHRLRRRAFTVTELLVVIGVIALLVGILVPALSGAFQTGIMAKSQNRLRQISTWMHLYSTENRDFVVPSQFDYTFPGCPTCHRGKVRSVNDDSAMVGPINTGTWTDILWTLNDVGALPQLADGTNIARYRVDSPDAGFYALATDYDENPFRSYAPNSHNAGADLPRPYGTGAAEISQPGYFAANDFFNADLDSPTFNATPGSKDGFWSNAQILAPERSMYAIDSFVGETIDDAADPFFAQSGQYGQEGTCEVDFRYANDMCIMLFLDGHNEPQNRWIDLVELQGAPGATNRGRGVRISGLTTR